MQIENTWSMGNGGGAWGMDFDWDVRCGSGVRKTFTEFNERIKQQLKSCHIFLATRVVRTPEFVFLSLTNARGEWCPPFSHL